MSIFHLFDNTATEYKNLNKKIDPLKRVVLPNYLLQLDSTKLINRMIIELFNFHVLLFIIVFVLLHMFIYPLFQTAKLKEALHIFLISLVPSIYYYMNNMSMWNHYIISNLITSLVAYFVIIYLSEYFNYFIIQIIIVLVSFIFMILCNSIDITALAYGLIGYSLVSKIGFEGFVVKWMIYVVVSFIILVSVIYLNNHIFTYFNHQSKITNHT